MKTLAMEHYSSPWSSSSTSSHYHYHPAAKATKSLDTTGSSYFQNCSLASTNKFSNKFAAKSASSSSVSRSLFGPSDPRESRRVQKEEFASQRFADRSRWNFDFQSEKPSAGRYDWSKINKTKQRHASGDSTDSSWSSLSKKFQENSLDKRNNNNSSWPSAYSDDRRSPDLKKKF